MRRGLTKVAVYLYACSQYHLLNVAGKGHQCCNHLEAETGAMTVHESHECNSRLMGTVLTLFYRCIREGGQHMIARVAPTEPDTIKMIIVDLSWQEAVQDPCALCHKESVVN